MQKYVNWCIDQFGEPIDIVTITVYEAGTANKATIYSDDGVTSKSNPFTGESDGSFFFFAANGAYDIVRAKTGYTFDDTDLEDIRLFDPTDAPENTYIGIIISDTLGNRPAAGTAGRYFLATDLNLLYRDDGSNWDLVPLTVLRRMPLQPMPQSDFWIREGDTEPALEVQLIEGTSAKNLSGLTVQFNMEDKDGTLVISNGSVDLVDPIQGICRYVWQDGDTDTKGRYFGVFYVVEDDESFPNYREVIISIHD